MGDFKTYYLSYCIFIVLLTGLITLYLEYKLKIIDDKRKQEKYINDTSMADYKVVSHRTEKYLK